MKQTKHTDKHKSHESETVVGIITTPSATNKTALMGGILALIVLVISGYLLISTGKPTPNPMTQDPSTTQSATEVTADAMVSIEKAGFNPATIQVKAGSTITWTNNDTMAHALSFIGHDDLDSDSLSPGDTYSLTFDTVGSYPYNDPASTSLFSGSVDVE